MYSTNISLSKNYLILQKKVINKELALLKAQQYCAYQERCAYEVKNKLNMWGQSPQIIAQIIAELIAENFLSDERFVYAYTRDKFRFNSWGRVRIRQELNMRHLPPELIEAALSTLDDESLLRPNHNEGDENSPYEAQIEQIMRNKIQKTPITDPLRWQKAAAQALRRGFEGNLVWAIVRRLKLEEGQQISDDDND